MTFSLLVLSDNLSFVSEQRTILQLNQRDNYRQVRILAVARIGDKTQCSWRMRGVEFSLLLFSLLFASQQVVHAGDLSLYSYLVCFPLWAFLFPSHLICFEGGRWGDQWSWGKRRWIPTERKGFEDFVRKPPLLQVRLCGIFSTRENRFKTL